MATPALVNLLDALLADLYGAVGARILRLLLLQGGLSAREIARQSGLGASAVQRSLVSLVTNRFVLFWQVSGKQTLYFGNVREVYALLWTGSFVASVPDHLRAAAEDAVIEALVPQTAANAALVHAGALQLAAEHEFWPEAELVQSLEAQALREVQADPDTMGKSETAKRAQVLADSQRELHRIRTAAPNSGGPHLYKINWNKFLVESRRAELAAYAQRTVGAVTAQVYDVLLRLSERTITEPRALRVPTPDSTVTTQNIVAELSADVLDEMRTAFLGSNDSSAKRVRTNAGTAQLAGSKPAELVNKHLDLLVESSVHFVQRVGGREGGEWFVPFDRVIADLQRDTLDDIVARSLGEPAARLLRLIRGQGKLDEKMLGNHALLPSLEIRHQMSALGFYGFADIQELAKPGDRGSSAVASQKRSLFLWYHRPKWAYQRLVDLLYAQMLATLRETQALREQHRILLAKLTREDVQSNMAELLTEREHKELEQFQENERALFQRMGMLDRHVRIFREY